ncbi:MAG: ATP-binding protein, partial [Spirochaetaceae bacterium]|nr:ATP-binding protein [Spirochaetaceae bacterium]
VPVPTVTPEDLLKESGEDTKTVRARVELARDRQKHRYQKKIWKSNAEIPPGEIRRFIVLDDASTDYFKKAVLKLGLSSRAAHGVLKVARTLADLESRQDVILKDVLEALQHRRYGDRDLFWRTI